MIPPSDPGHDRRQKIACLADRLFDLLVALPRRNDEPPTDEKMKRWAETIAGMIPWDSPFPNGMKQAKRSVVQQELTSFARSIKQADQQLLKLHNPSFGKALEAGTSVHELRQSLRNALRFAEQIETLSLADVPEKTARGTEHSYADVVAQQCAMYFFWITGRPPGRLKKDGEISRSKFEIFLGEIFIEMGIDASADERARKAAAGFKRRWGKRAKTSD
jgi:hypothetical protein